MNKREKIFEYYKTRWSDNPFRDVCLRLLDSLINSPEDELRMLTFQSFAKMLGKRAFDDEILNAVAILSSSKTYALKKGLLYIDGENEHVLDEEELKLFRDTGVMIDPESGQEVENAADKLVPFFYPSELIREAKASASA